MGPAIKIFSIKQPLQLTLSNIVVKIQKQHFLTLKVHITGVRMNHDFPFSDGLV
jgi:hypothetical protein